MEKHIVPELYNEDYRNKTSQKLHSLPTSLDKIKFWYNDLKLFWLDQQGVDRYKGIELAPFKFTVPDDEREGVNQWIIDNYLRLSIDSEKEKRYLLESSLKAELEKEILSSSNRVQAIKKVQKRIDDSFNKVPSGSRFVAFEAKYNFTYYVHIEVYNDYKKLGLEPNYAEVHSSTFTVLTTRNALVLADFRTFLDQELNPAKDHNRDNDEIAELKQQVENLQSQVFVKDGKRPLKPAQLMLLFYHLGLLKPIIESDLMQLQKAQLIATLLNVGAENVEKNMMKVGTGSSEYETEKHYQALFDFLDDAGLKSLYKDWKIKKR